MGCGCAERRAKLKAWAKKQQQKRIARKIQKKMKEQTELLKQLKESVNDTSTGN